MYIIIIRTFSLIPMGSTYEYIKYFISLIEFIFEKILIYVVLHFVIRTVVITYNSLM